MSVALTKGGNVSLSKSAPNLTSIAVGLDGTPGPPPGRTSTSTQARCSPAPTAGSSRRPLRFFQQPEEPRRLGGAHR